MVLATSGERRWLRGPIRFGPTTSLLSTPIACVKTSVSASEQTLSATMEQLRIGEATLFNTIRTEDEVLGDRLELIRMLQSYYQTLARLKFEAGTLVTVEGAGGAAEALVFNASEFSR